MSQVTTPRNSVMINPDDAVMLLIDHQSGLFQLVKDIPVPKELVSKRRCGAVRHSLEVSGYA